MPIRTAPSSKLPRDGGVRSSVSRYGMATRQRKPTLSGPLPKIPMIPRNPPPQLSSPSLSLQPHHRRTDTCLNFGRNSEVDKAQLIPPSYPPSPYLQTPASPQTTLIQNSPPSTAEAFFNTDLSDILSRTRQEANARISDLKGSHAKTLSDREREIKWLKDQNNSLEARNKSLVTILDQIASGSSSSYRDKDLS